MKLIIETNGCNQFEIQVSEFASLQEIKKKVEEKQGIPISKQTLTVNGNILLDDLDLPFVDINDRSRIHLDIAADPGVTYRPPPQDIIVTLRMPEPFHQTLNLELNVNGTIQQLKELIQEVAKIPVFRIVIRNPIGLELPDYLTLLQCRIMEKSALTVEFLPAASKPTSSSQPAPAPAPAPPSQYIPITLKMPAPFSTLSLDVDVNGTIQQLKEQIQEMSKTPINRIAIRNEIGLELPDYMTLHQCRLLAKSAVSVELLPAASKPASPQPEPRKIPKPRW